MQYQVNTTYLFLYVIPDDSARKISEMSSPLHDPADQPISTATDTIFSTPVVISSSAETPTSVDVLVCSSGSGNDLSVIDRNILPSTTIIQVPSTASTISELPIYPLSTVNCAQCKIIEQELGQHVSTTNNTYAISKDVSIKSSTKTPTSSKLGVPSPRTPPRPDRNVWQVDTTTASKRLPLSPIESVQEMTSSDIDSTSFIILREDVDTSKELLLATANLSINGKSISTTAQSSINVPTSTVPTTVLINSETKDSEISNRTAPTTAALTISAPPTTAPSDKPASPSSQIAGESSNSKERCNDCCFCNPNLHSRDGAISAQSCSYCNQQRQSARPITPPPKTQETRSTNTTHFYETLSKTDHTHVRTRSKDSDTVSLKCTRTNSKLRRFIPDDTVSGNAFDDLTAASSVATAKEKLSHWSKNASSHDNLPQKPPKAPAALPTKKGRSVLEDAKTSQKTGGHVRLPSPFTGIVSSSRSYDSASSSSQCSSSSSSPSNPSKKCPALPVARWQNQTSSGNHRTGHVAKPRASRYQNFYGNNGTVADDVVAVNGAANTASIATKGVAEISTTTNQTSGNYLYII